MPSKSDAAQDKNCPYCTDISKAGKLRNIISGTRGEGKYEVHSFRQELRQNIHSKNFNAAEMAENAPDRFKAWAAWTGFALDAVSNQWEDKATAIKATYSEMPYRSGAMGLYHRCCHVHGPKTAGGLSSFLASMSPEDRAEMHAFRQDVRQAIQDGTFNAEELAAKAPAKLKAWAEENSIDLEEALNQWGGKVTIPEELQPINTVS